MAQSFIRGSAPARKAGVWRHRAAIVLAVGISWASPAVVQGQTCEPQGVPVTTPSQDFAVNQDGTVLHKKTGLVWMRCSLGQTWDGATCTGTVSEYDWRRALQARVDLNTAGGYAGQTDWRVPNIKELGTIFEMQCYEPAINLSMFPATPVLRYWSSTPDFRHPAARALFVNFRNGYTDDAWVGDAHALRLVRGGGAYDSFDKKR